MEDSVLIKALRTLNKKEIRDFARFAASPYHNGRSEVTKYFDVLKKYYPDFNGGGFTAERIFSELYPGKKFRGDTIRKLSSFLYKLLEDYLSVSGFMEDGFLYKQILSTQVISKGLYRNYEKLMKELDAEYAELTGESEFYFWKKFMLEREKNSYYMISGNDHLASETILRRADYFAYNTVLGMNKILLTLLLNEKNFNADFSKTDFYELVKKTDMEDYLSHLNKTGNKFYPVIALYYYQFKAFMDIDNEDYFNKYKKLLFSNINSFAYIDKLNLFTIFEGICTLKIEQGNMEHQKELFEAYNNMLKMGLYSFNDGGEFIVKLFRNFILIGIQLKEYAWLEEFLREYSPKLPEESRQNMVDLAEAMLLFEKREYERSLKTLTKIDYEIFHFKIDIKNLQLKIYYEMNHYNEAYSFIDSYKHFIANNKFISQRYKIMAGSFVEIVKKLLKAKELDNHDEAHIIENELKSMKSIIFREWLTEKITELKTG